MRIATPVAWTFASLMSAGIFHSAMAQDQIGRLRAALMAPERPAEDKARDEARKPVETIQFVGIEEGMTVLDVYAGAGWFTEVLSAAVGPQGRVYMHNQPGAMERRGPEFRAELEARAERLGNVELLIRDVTDDLGVDGQMDAAITALNLHDVYEDGEENAVAFLRGIYDALKPGGVAGIIDHVGVAGNDNVALHRIEKSTVRDLLEQAGFVVEAESDVLANPEDDHSLHVREAELGRHTDQMLFRVRKP